MATYKQHLDPQVWYPFFKFTLQTIGMTYPNKPNDVTKKKYFTLIQNLPFYFPIHPMGKNFGKLLNEYPVQPYLDNRMDFGKWIHYITNKLNEELELPTNTFYESLEEYYDKYKPKELIDQEYLKKKKKFIYAGVGGVMLMGIYWMYNN
jgi:hypothetical protein|tara:strand:- start:293 stop:739 length:447 start_codon:yes stop_codon:yes gene_type:complete